MKLIRFADAGHIKIGQLVDNRIVSTTNDDMSALITNWDRYTTQGALDQTIPGAGRSMEDVAS